jgi:hypothetical protein
VSWVEEVEEKELAIAFKSLTKVIDIAIDAGYSIFVHKKPLPFPV